MQCVLRSHHDRMHGAIQQHAALLRAGEVHDQQKQAKGGGVVVQVQEVAPAVSPHQDSGVKPLSSAKKDRVDAHKVHAPGTHNGSLCTNTDTIPSHTCHTRLERLRWTAARAGPATVGPLGPGPALTSHTFDTVKEMDSSRSQLGTGVHIKSSQPLASVSPAAQM
jgi:hypothetical protein